jgi:hypothetical protein
MIPPVRPETPNNALQRAAPSVTAPASATFAPAMQPARRTPPSMSLIRSASLAHSTRNEREFTRKQHPQENHEH